VHNSNAVRDHTGRIKAVSSPTEGQLELHVHERVVEAHGGRRVGVSGNIQNGEGRVLHSGLELGKRAQCQGEQCGRSVSGDVEESGRGGGTWFKHSVTDYDQAEQITP
jgi:hypothetical protein